MILYEFERVILTWAKGGPAPNSGDLGLLAPWQCSPRQDLTQRVRKFSREFDSKAASVHWNPDMYIIKLPPITSQGDCWSGRGFWIDSSVSPLHFLYISNWLSLHVLMSISSLWHSFPVLPASDLRSQSTEVPCVRNWSV